MLRLPNREISGPISLQYTLTALGGNTYEYVYTIYNNGSLPGGAPVVLFDILFDTALYESTSLQIDSPPSIAAQWDQQLLFPLPGIPADYDALSLTGGIPAGQTVTGFAVKFTWLGTGTPGAQPFQIYSFTVPTQLLQSGQSTPPLTAPAASTVTLILLGIGLTLTAVRLVAGSGPKRAAE